MLVISADHITTARYAITPDAEIPTPAEPEPEPPTNPDELLNVVTARRIAASLGIHLPARTLRSAIERGNIPGASKRGSRWLIRRGDFDTWLSTYTNRR